MKTFLKAHLWNRFGNIYHNILERYYDKSDVKHICHMPFENLRVETTRNRLCCFTKPISYSKDFSNFEEIFNSKSAIDIRSNILKGSYVDCDQRCPLLQHAKTYKKLKRRTVFNFGGPIKFFREVRRDYTKAHPPLKSLTMSLEDGCNLSCPSCRPKEHGNTLSENSINQAWDTLWNKNLKELESLYLGGAGEPLMQKNVIQFLKNCDEKAAPKLKHLSIITHGLFFDEQMWNRINPYLKDKLEIIVSIDGVSKEVYLKNRVGSDYEKLHRNLEFLSKQNLPWFIFTIVIQKNNYKEIPDFISMARKYNALTSLGHLDPTPHHSAEYIKENCVQFPEHPKHEDFIRILKESDIHADDVNASMYNALLNEETLTKEN